jgi:hypothetical protein
VVGDTIAQYVIGGMAAVVLGVSGAMKWFAKTKEKLVKKIDDMEEKMEKHFELDETRHREHSVTLERLESNQNNTHERLVEMKAQINSTALNGAYAVREKFDVIMDKFEEGLKEIRNMKK